MQKKLKIYLDTSVINFLFSDQSQEKKEITIDFFENYLDDYDVYISDFVIIEIEKTTNLEKKTLLLNALEKYNLIVYEKAVKEINEIADIYIKNGIIPEKKLDDALHVAFCTFFEFDILLSWNFRHLANINKQEKINTINTSLGFRKQLLLLNPMEVIYE
jgi:hypothetical protein